MDTGDPNLPQFPSAAPYVTATTDPGATPVADGMVTMPSDPPDMGFHYDGTPLPPRYSALTQVDATTGSEISTVTLNSTVQYKMFTTASTDPSVASSKWYMMGSAHGSYPGFTFGGILLPLTYDGYSSNVLSSGSYFYFDQAHTMPTGGPPQGAFSGGYAEVFFYVPPSIPGVMLPVTLTHAFFVEDLAPGGASLGFRAPSNPISLTIQ